MRPKPLMPTLTAMFVYVSPLNPFEAIKKRERGMQYGLFGIENVPYEDALLLQQ